MNGSTVNFTGGNSTMYETFWPCFYWYEENNVDFDQAVAACSHLPNLVLDQNKKVGIASAAVGTVALLMNVVVLSGVLKNHQLSKPMYMFVANLAVADCVAGLFSFFFCASFQLEFFTLWMRLGFYCTFFVVLVLSAVGVVLLSMDRYLAILHPIFYQTRMSGRHVAVSLGIAWPASLLVCLSPLMGWNCSNIKIETCLMIVPVSYLILTNAILLMSVVIVVFVNVRIFIELKRRFSRTRPPENSRDDLEDCEMKARPYWGFLIALFNSVVNPIIYALRIKKIREAVHHRARRLANSVRAKFGWSSNEVVNIHQIVAVGDARVMDAVAGPSTDSRTDQPPKWAASRRANPRVALS
ncbi:PREDICTED: adenosine receptor A2b-like [Branchiostoma belcheri]|uniref:Adenosine receptor A2b-like n=1 Tax=Branchiostoma belcheri TaxID=7741 RepID=A0A6P4XVI8_BRABE|nr:PREDICTED: adenosine receptor A2b-like [Branchiostoma belcheri]